MQLSSLPKTTTRSKKRKGRGYGSGAGGHTSTRGMKGQKSRSSVAIWFEGGQLPLAKRVPFLKGKDRFKPLSKVVTVNIGQLNDIKAGTTVTAQTLVQSRLISLKEASSAIIKVLGGGDLTTALKFKDLKVSKSAKIKIEKAGGSVAQQTND